MIRCEKIWRWEDVMIRCENIWRWEDVMIRCDDRPPILEEPFAQTLSGKIVYSADVTLRYIQLFSGSNKKKKSIQPMWSYVMSQNYADIDIIWKMMLNRHTKKNAVYGMCFKPCGSWSHSLIKACFRYAEKSAKRAFRRAFIPSQRPRHFDLLNWTSKFHRAWVA